MTRRSDSLRGNERVALAKNRQRPVRRSVSGRFVRVAAAPLYLFLCGDLRAPLNFKRDARLGLCAGGSEGRRHRAAGVGTGWDAADERHASGGVRPLENSRRHRGGADGGGGHGHPRGGRQQGRRRAALHPPPPHGGIEGALRGHGHPRGGRQQGRRRAALHPPPPHGERGGVPLESGSPSMPPQSRNRLPVKRSGLIRGL
eukprot:1195654-Prorocentrum_minimum.AAC.1